MWGFLAAAQQTKLCQLVLTGLISSCNQSPTFGMKIHIRDELPFAVYRYKALWVSGNTKSYLNFSSGSVVRICIPTSINHNPLQC